MASFADLQYYLCWHRWVSGPKKAKTSWCYTWMVSNAAPIFSDHQKISCKIDWLSWSTRFLWTSITIWYIYHKTWHSNSCLFINFFHKCTFAWTVDIIKSWCMILVWQPLQLYFKICIILCWVFQIRNPFLDSRPWKLIICLATRTVYKYFLQNIKN